MLLKRGGRRPPEIYTISCASAHVLNGMMSHDDVSKLVAVSERLALCS